MAPQSKISLSRSLTITLLLTVIASAVCASFTREKTTIKLLPIVEPRSHSSTGEELTSTQTQTTVVAEEPTKEEAKWPHNSCDMCPGPRFMRHTGYQVFAHWTNKPGAQNLLPQRYCPPKTQAALAEEIILGLIAAGYTKTAEFLEATQVLMSLKEPATLLAPTDEAFAAGNIPVHLSQMLGDWRAEISLPRNLMSYHLLREFKPFSQFLKLTDEDCKLKTMLGDAEVESSGFSTVGLSYVKIHALPELNRGSLPSALVVKKDLLCNQLLVVHGVNHVLIPPVKFLPAGTPAAPTFRGGQLVKPVSHTARVMAA